MQILDPEVVSIPYENQAPYEGWHEQQEIYEDMDDQARNAGWKLHNTFREQVGSAVAQLELEIPLLGQVLNMTNSTVVELGRTNLGPVYYDLNMNNLLVNCGTGCSDSAVLTITSTGTGAFTPGEQDMAVAFAGDRGQAKISLLGLELDGFTLNGGQEGLLFPPNVDSVNPQGPEGVE
jgi:hypothetical protein